MSEVPNPDEMRDFADLEATEHETPADPSTVAEADLDRFDNPDASDEAAE